MDTVVYSDGHRDVFAIGKPGAGGAKTNYAVHRTLQDVDSGHTFLADLPFQYDTIRAVGVVGWTNEALLAVVRHRLQALQSGEFPCDENNVALGYVDRALITLEKRTADRKARGVEGKHEA